MQNLVKENWQQVCLLFIQDKCTPLTPRSNKDLPCSSGFGPSLHLVHSTSSRIPRQDISASTNQFALECQWLDHNSALMVTGWLKLRSEGLCVMMLLGSHFLHLNHNSVHRRWAPIPRSPLLFFCASSRRLVSNIYLLPFQLDKDNVED